MRQLCDQEKPLVKYLLRKAGLDLEINDLKVEEMKDGGMGSLIFQSEGSIKRRLGGVAAEAKFIDIDGIVVLAALNLDLEGNLFELDMWKTDLEPLQRWPAVEQLSEVKYAES